MFLWVDYERVKISFVISVFNPPEWSPCAFASTTGLCLWQPSKSGVLTQRLRLKTALANIFGAYPILGYIAHQGLLFTPGLSDAIRKSILHKKCKVLFSCHIPRRSVKICARSNGWFIAAHSAPKKVSEADVESFHVVIGMRALEAVLIAKAVLSLSRG